MGFLETNTADRHLKRATHEEYDASTSSVDKKIATQKFKTESHVDDHHVYHNVKLEELPDYLELKKLVDAEISRMSWWESYGIDSTVHAGAVVLALASYFIMRSDSTAALLLGMFILGCCHHVLAVKGGHNAAHRSAVQSAPLNRLLGFFFSDLCGTFPSDAGYSMHIKEHHPYTNVINIGDSGTWKFPVVPAYLYMFVTPLLVPLITPFVSMMSLWGRWLQLARFVVIASLGLYANFWLMLHVSGFTLTQAVAVTLASRAVLSIPYIHVNIFQHIGLPMYTVEDKPKKIYQMSTGVLNLPSNLLLDYCFGHSIMSAHVEHHLFPRLSDEQCLRAKPTVRRFLRARGMAYNEAPYLERMALFLRNYNQLMVHAPPISHFVGLQ